MCWFACRVSYFEPRAARTDTRTGLEIGQLESIVIEQAGGLRIRREQYLKAAIKKEAVLPIRLDTAANAIRGLEDLRVDAFGFQLARTR